MRHPLAIPVLAAAFMGSAVAVFGGCSATLAFEECETNAECEAPLICAERLCVSPASVLAGKEWRSAECTILVWPEGASDATLIGVLMPLSGRYGALGLGAERAAAMALDELDEADSGTQIAALYCDTAGDPAQTLRAFQHINSLGAPAVIGPLLDETALALKAELNAASAASGFTSNFPATVVISPGAGALTLDDATDPPRFWRALTPLSGRMETVVAALAGAVPSGPAAAARVALIHDNGPSGAAFSARFEAALDGETEVWDLPLDLSDPGAPSAMASTLIAFGPEAVVVATGPEGGQLVYWLASLYAEQGWTPPLWMLSEAARAPSLFTAGGGGTATELGPEAMAANLWGVAPAAEGAISEGFRAAYSSRWNLKQPPIYAAEAYDATYAVALAIGSANAARPSDVDAVAIRSGLGRLSAGVSVPVGPTGLATARSGLAASPTSTIDLQGASGPLSFGVDGGVDAGFSALWRPNVENGRFEDIVIPTPSGGTR